MKIGITTFQRAHNFGAQMQMYALAHFLEGEGFDVSILDYHNPWVEDQYVETRYFHPYKKFFFKRIYPGVVLFFRCILTWIFGYQRIKIERFNQFLIESFKLTRRFNKPSDIPMDFDVLITGSDQVWNYFITHGRCEVYFLDNHSHFGLPSKKISYAVSVEASHFQELIQDVDYVKLALKSFTWVSVREKALADLLEEKFNIHADAVVDPSLFLTKEECVKLAVKPKEEKYLCVYRIEHTSYLPKLARRIAKERGLRIVNVYAANMAKCKSESYGPREILGYICYADVVVTSSFHGTAFSIINCKDFYAAYDRPSVRVQNLLSLLDLQNRFLTKLEDYTSFSKISYNDELLQMQIKESKDKLIRAIHS